MPIGLILDPDGAEWSQIIPVGLGSKCLNEPWSIAPYIPPHQAENRILYTPFELVSTMAPTGSHTAFWVVVKIMVPLGS